jgi:3,4-dihydroxy 2-butanone 4-phosphate synthase/GTP cyclohydrolase II
MTLDNKTPHGTAFTVSIEAASGVTTGISAFDRAHTIQVAVAADACPDDIVQPGHVFPITARLGGVLMRAGHTEAGCDFASLAGLEPAAVICEIMNEDGSMARLPDLLTFAGRHGFRVGTIAGLINHRAASETLIERVASRPIQTAHGEFILHVYRERIFGTVNLALVKGDISACQETLVRVHEPFSVLDFFGVGKHAYPIDEAEAAIAKNGHGVIVLMHRPESSEEIIQKVADPSGKALRGARWDPRIYGIGAQILRDLGVGKMRLLAYPRKMPSMKGFSLEVVDFLPPESEK